MDDAELQEVQKLASFRMELKKIIDKGTDTTLAGVKDVSDLEKEDMDNWEAYKFLLKESQTLVGGEVDVNLDEVKKILDKCGELEIIFMSKVSTTSNLFDVMSGKRDGDDPVQVGGEENKNKRQFYNWLNNRLNILINYIQLLLDDPTTMRPIVSSDLKKQALKIGMQS